MRNNLRLRSVKRRLTAWSEARPTEAVAFVVDGRDLKSLVIEAMKRKLGPTSMPEWLDRRIDDTYWVEISDLPSNALLCGDFKESEWDMNSEHINRMVPLLVCGSCGDAYCISLTARIVRTQGCIVWDPICFKGAEDAPVGVGPLVFNERQYRQAVAAFRQHNPAR